MSGVSQSDDNGSVSTLEVRNATVTLARTQVVRGVDLVLRAGEIVGVLGPSGAGKTTLFRALVGELPLTGGTVRLGGLDVGQMPLWRRARQGLGYVPQTPSILIDLTVRENLRTFESLGGRGAFKGPEHWADLAELRHRLDLRAGSLSGGERRRLELMRALIPAPRVLICDEPFAGIDPGGAERMGQLLRQQAQQGTSILLADHHVDEALGVCSRAILLLDGSVVVDGPPAEFRDHPLVRGRYLGSWYRSLPPRPGVNGVRVPDE